MLSAVTNSSLNGTLGSSPYLPAFQAAALACACFLGSMRLSRALSPQLSSAYRKLSQNERLDWDSRFPSTMHALLISATAAYLCLFAPELADGPDQPYMLRTSRLSTAALGFSAGYFALDLYFVLRHFPLLGDAAMVGHHVAALVSVVVSSYYRQCHTYTLAMLATECTTPFVNARWLLDRAGYREAGVYVANGMALLAAWVVGRLLLFLFYFSHVWDHRAEIALVSRTIAAFTWVMPALLFALNIFWFVKILRGAARMVTGQPSRRALAAASARAAVAGGVAKAD